MRGSSSSRSCRRASCSPVPRRGRQRELQAGVALTVVTAARCAGGDATAADLAKRGVLTWEGAGRAFAGGGTKADLVEVVPDGVDQGRVRVRRAAVPAADPRRAAPERHGSGARECGGRAGRPQRHEPAADHLVRGRRGHSQRDRKLQVAPDGDPEPRSRDGPLARGRARSLDPEPGVGDPGIGRPGAAISGCASVCCSMGPITPTGSAARRAPGCGPRAAAGPARGTSAAQIWNDPLSAIQTARWCPGTYRVSGDGVGPGAAGRTHAPGEAVRQRHVHGSAVSRLLY